MGKTINDFFQNLYDLFISKDRWLTILQGTGNTLLISLLAIIIGVTIGILLALAHMSNNRFLRGINRIYLDIIRGTPSFTQLIVINFVIFASIDVNKIVVASLAFGINSGAYVSEIIRAGILSIDSGQTEAGRSLGLNKKQTMQYIILPQAIKNILPALANEFIVLIKETAVAGYIAVLDITKAFQRIQSATYQTTLPLLMSAVFYYIIIKSLTILFTKMEKNMRKSDRKVNKHD